MDQRRFEQTFRHIVNRLNNLGPDARKPGDPRPAPVTNHQDQKTGFTLPYKRTDNA